MKRTAAQWNAILIQCQVKPLVAAMWSTVFADTIKDDTFSAGEQEIADFLGQVIHESAGLTVMAENLDYSAARIQQIGFAAKPGTRWRAMADRAYELQHNPQAFANALYGGRMGNNLGDDGWKFRGRSPIEITGHDNYLVIGDLMGQDLTVMPELLEQPHYGLEATIALWNKDIPDSIVGDEEKITQRIQGGQLGLQHRTLIAKNALSALAA